jgi:MFS family permease
MAHVTFRVNRNCAPGFSLALVEIGCHVRPPPRNAPQAQQIEDPLLSAATEKRGWRAVPRTVWALGLVSLLMDTSSEMIHALLPVFLVGTLGASAATVGFIEGVGEATASIVKVFSGWLSDRLGKRKLLTVLGYGLAALSKPLFPLATSPAHVLTARFADRIGKGVRGAPRDALVADVTPAEIRGAAFGLRQALDTVGAFAGPLAAIGLMLVLAGNIRAVFWFALIPAALCVLLLIFGVDEPKAPADRAPRKPVTWSEVVAMPAAFWAVVAVGVVFSLARFSEAFLILRAHDAKLPLALTPVVLVLMNLVYAGLATPAGALSDRIDRRLILAGGLGVLIAADLVLALWAGLAGALTGVALWGLHMALTQGLLAALVADSAPARLRGTAFGVFNLAGGVALLAASTLAGFLWDRIGAAATFEMGAVFAAASLVGLLIVISRRPKAVV